MDSNYDEDLSENPFFEELKTEHAEIFNRSIEEGWMICVPRFGSIQLTALCEEDILSHILIPSDELPESHFRSLTGKFVRMSNRVLIVDHTDTDTVASTHIIFEETFYTDQYLKYKVWCLESPLESIHSQKDKSLNSITTLRDSIDLLWTESLGRNTLESLDSKLQSFSQENPTLEFSSLQTQIDLVGLLYKDCLQIALQDKTNRNKNVLANLKLAIETYMQHGIYKRLFEGICACTAFEDSKLNKLIRNLSDLQLRDLGIRPDLYETIPCAKQELAKINGYSTVIGKVGCLRKTIAALTKHNLVINNITTFLSADELIPMMVFLIIKTGIANWNAQVTFMNKFRYSSTPSDEASFLITTLEAAIKHIRSEELLGPQDPESQLDEILDSYELINMPTINNEKYTNENKFSIAYLFEQIRIANCEEVKTILERSTELKNSENIISEEHTAKLCHPLCSCDTCEGFLSQSLCDTSPTVHSSDDRGFTALHVACLHGRPKIVDLLLSYHADVNANDYARATPLHYAALRGHQNAVLLLLHSGADMNAFENEKNTPLHYAATNGHEDCIKAILYFSEHSEKKLNINSVNSFGDTPLHHAARWGYEGIVDILLEYGARINIENKRKLTPLDCAHSIHISRLLFERKSKPSNFVFVPLISSLKKKPSPKLDFADENSTRITGVKPQSTTEIKRMESLFRAIEFGDTHLTCYYLNIPSSQIGFEENHSLISSNLCHPLCTCEKCSPRAVDCEKQQQESKKLSVNVCNSDGITPLHVAATHGRVEITKLLLENFALTDLQSRSRGHTPLHLACIHRRPSVVRILVQTCSIDKQDDLGSSALFYACHCGDIRIVEMLRSANANPLLKNNSGKTPLDEAQDQLFLSVVSYLKTNMMDT